jgi:3-phenylpropionate/trans-cinnamate dioxygenase ferredoxin reductase subunit
MRRAGSSSVDRFLETSVPGIWAAGDVARWPDPRSGDPVRIEHWVVAQRQGQAAARNMMRKAEDRVPFEAVPFFWSRHYDVAINYVGHAPRWDRTTIEGDLSTYDGAVSYHAGGRVLAVATVGRDRLNLEAEASMERGVAHAG